MSSPHQILVVGQESKLGAALVAQLTKRGDHVIATTRRPVGKIYLDLANLPKNWRPPDNVVAAYVCAGITSIQECETRPQETARANVDGTIELCRRLARSGVFSVVFSSNLVFDGERSPAQPDETVNPRCAYGRQKAALESILQQEKLAVAVIRMTKVLDPGHPLFGKWTENLLGGRPIDAFSDMMMAPVTLAHAVATSLAVGDAERRGITHVSARADISYYQAALRLAERLHVDACLVRPVSAAQSATAPKIFPRHTTLAPTDPSGSLQPDPFAAVDAFADQHSLAGRSQ